MNKLISANLFRLKKNKLFYSVIAVYFVYFCIFLKDYNNLQNMGQIVTLLDLLTVIFTFTPLIIMFVIGLGIVASIFISEDFQSGAIRNKVIVGASKIEIYLANLITTVIIGAALITMFLVLTATVGGIVLGYKIEITAIELITMILVIYGMVVAYSSVITFISMLFKNMTASVLICIGFFVLMSIVVHDLVIRLDVPPTSWAYVMEDGVMVQKEFENFMKLGPVANEVVRFFTKLLPTGQLYYILNTTNQVYSEHIDGAEIIMLLYSTIITIIVTLGGIFLFKKSDIK